MSFTSEVSAFMETLGPFYESVEKDEDNQMSIISKNHKIPGESEISGNHVDKMYLEGPERILDVQKNDENSRTENNIHISSSPTDSSNFNEDSDFENSEYRQLHPGCNNDMGLRYFRILLYNFND